MRVNSKGVCGDGNSHTVFCTVLLKGTGLLRGECSWLAVTGNMEAPRECKQVPRATELQVLIPSLKCVWAFASHSVSSFLPYADILGKPKDQSTVHTLTSQSCIREEVSLLVSFVYQV